MPTSLTQQPTRTGALSRRDPLFALREEMDDLMTRFWPEWAGDWQAAEFVPSLDVSETDEAIEIRADLPGVSAEDIDIDVTGNRVRITGERREEKEETGRTFHRVERRAGRFSRSLTLPCAIQEDQVEAEERNGVLTIKLPKAEEAKTHKITVKGG